MRRCCFVALFVSCLMASPLTSAAQSGRLPSCPKSFEVTGTDASGQVQTFRWTVRRPRAEIAGFDSGVAEQQDERYYGGHYQVEPGSATHKLNCGGFIMNTLWGTGNTYVPADEFATKILRVFAHPITQGFASGDVVLFGADMHVALVTGIGATSSRARIRSKDNEESVITGELDVSLTGGSLDPIIRKNGAPRVYRFYGPVTMVPLAQEECDATPLEVTIEVAESPGGQLPLPGASVTLQLVGGQSFGSTTGSNGRAVFTFPKDKPDVVASARQGLTVAVSLTGFESRSVLIPADRLLEATRTWLVPLTRSANNPAGSAVADWDKRLKELDARVALAEKRKVDLAARRALLQTAVAAVGDAEREASAALTKLRQLKPTVDLIEATCIDAEPRRQRLAAIENDVFAKEQSAVALGKDLIDAAAACASVDDVAKVRNGTVRLRQIVNDMGAPAKQARVENDGLKDLQAEQQKHVPELTKLTTLRTAMAGHENTAGKAVKAAGDAYSGIVKLEAEMATARTTLTGELAVLRGSYPGGPMPANARQQFDVLNGRIGGLVGPPSPAPPADLAFKASAVATLGKEADTLIGEYRGRMCVIQPRDELLPRLAASVIFAGFALDSVLNTEAQLRQCEAGLTCELRLAEVGRALDVGDIETSERIIREIKPQGCDTHAVEARHISIRDQGSPSFSLRLGSARDGWRNIGVSCDYQRVYEEAIAIRREFPQHPWVLEHLPAIERGARAKQRIFELVTGELAAADRAGNHDEVDRVLSRIDEIAAPFPCLVSDAAKLRAEVLRQRQRAGSGVSGGTMWIGLYAGMGELECTMRADPGRPLMGRIGLNVNVDGNGAFSVTLRGVEGSFSGQVGSDGRFEATRSDVELKGLTWQLDGKPRTLSLSGRLFRESDGKRGTRGTLTLGDGATFNCKGTWQPW